MLHFRWNWVGLILLDNDKGIQILSDFRGEIHRNKLCVAFVKIMPESFNYENYDYGSTETLKLIMTSSANVVVVYDDTQSLHVLMLNFMQLIITWKVWIMNSQWDIGSGVNNFLIDSLHGSLYFAHHHNEMPSFRKYIETYNPSKYPDDHILAFLWNKHFNCSFSKFDCKILGNCLPNVSLQLLPANTWIKKMPEEGYNIYNSVYAVAHGLHDMTVKQIQFQSHQNWENVTPWEVIFLAVHFHYTTVLFANIKLTKCILAKKDMTDFMSCLL